MPKSSTAALPYDNRLRGHDMAKKPGRPTGKHNTDPDRHLGVGILIRVDPEFRAALKKVAHKDRRSLSKMCVVLLEEAMQQRKEWTPPPPKEEKQ